VPTRVTMEKDGRSALDAFLWGEVLLFGLLAATLALFVAHPGLRPSYGGDDARLVLQTVVMLAGTAVAVLAGLRFSVEGRRVDLLLASGFFVGAASTLCFSISPALGGHAIGRSEAWSGVVGRLLASTLIAAAPFVHGRVRERRRILGNGFVALAFVLVLVWSASRWLGTELPILPPDGGADAPFGLTLSFGFQAFLNLVAVVGFGLRFRKHGDDLDRFLALGATLLLFASLSYLLTPLAANRPLSQGDVLRILAYGVLLVGVWRAIRSSEFGRAVAEERARVAREIHDGLAQYLFAISTYASRLEDGAAVEEVLPALRDAAAAAQQEARFAVLALSSASGNAPFDAALRRYVEFLTADGQLEVELEVDPRVSLAPDEQIEVFRIVQEGLANVRKHAGARRAEVSIGERDGERVVSVRDDGDGFDGPRVGAGQGLENIRARSAAIEGALAVRSRPGLGTELVVTLRA
jgi:signal transduction histidine kinase